MTDRDASGKFIKGKSGNPGGRQKGELSISALIDSAVSETDWMFIVDVLLRMARRGNLKAIEMLMDRRFGKAIQQTDVNLNGEVVLLTWDVQPPASKE